LIVARPAETGSFEAGRSAASRGLSFECSAVGLSSVMLKLLDLSSHRVATECEGLVDIEGGHRFDPCRAHHPVLPNRRFPGRVRMGRFCGDFRRYLSALSVSGDICGLPGRFEPPVSASENSVPRRWGCSDLGPSGTRNFGSSLAKTDLSNPVRTYRGLNPRASNCRLHSAGASRSRSTPMPRGKRPGWFRSGECRDCLASGVLLAGER
jgi:hypothetical protein